MNKRITQLVIFLLVVFLADRTVGLSLKRLYDNSKMPWIAEIRYSIDSTNQDILIFGSSRAKHHYIPDTITKYTGWSAYNCGIDGQGLAFSYIQIHETLKRYSPKLIILDLSPNIIFNSRSEEKLKTLLPYCSKDVAIKNILTNGSILEKSKFLSDIYPYNGTVYSTLSAFFHHFEPDMDNGYAPIAGTLDVSKFKDETYAKDNQYEFAQKQTVFLYKIMDECKAMQIRLMLVLSPTFREGESDKRFVGKLFAQCRNRSGTIVFEDYSSNPEFRQQQDLFKDNLHLNDIGAHEFSRMVAELILKDNNIPNASFADIDYNQEPTKVR